MSAAEVGTDGRVKRDASGNYITTEEIKDVEYDRTRIERLADAKYILLRAEANSLNAGSTTGTNSQVVKLYDDYVVNVRLSIKLDLSVTP